MKITILWVVLSIIPNSAFAASAEVLTLEPLLKEAEENNPAVRSRLEQWIASKTDAKIAGAFPDPALKVAIMAEELETRAGPMKGKAGFSQKIPFWGKRGLRSEAASGRSGAAEAAYRAKVLEVRANLTAAFYDLVFLKEAEKILAEQVELLRHFSRVAEKKYSVGKGPQAMVFRSEAELSRMKNEVFIVTQRARRVKSGIRAMLGREPGSEIADPGQGLVPKKKWSFQDLAAKAKAHRPELRALRAMKDASEAEKKLALKRFFPDFSIGYEYTAIGAGTTNSTFDGKDAHGLMAGLSLPLWMGVNRAGLERSQAKRRAAAYDIESMEKDTLAQVDSLVIQSETFLKLTKVDEETVLPQVRSAVKATLSSYEANTASFVELLDAERALLKSELGHAMHKSMYWKIDARLERVIGGPL